MTDHLVVIMGDVVAGTLERLAGDRLRFRYEADYRSIRDATPLSVSMPVQLETHDDHVVKPWLAGLLPDNDAVLQRWAREFQTSRSPFSLLSTPIGHDCAGAVRFAKPDELATLLSRRGTVDWLTEKQVGERLRNLKQDSTSWLGEAFTGQFSLAGAQAKTALLFRNGKWGVPSGATPTSHILKPAVVGLDDHDLNEHLCLDAAHRAGLIVAKTSIEKFAKETAIVVERYDRRLILKETKRIHQEDLCQAFGRPPTQKYQNDGGPTPGEIVSLFRRAMSPRVADAAVWRFIDALIWNWLIAGTDAHAKNYSLLLDGSEVRLAPLYDIASALPYDVHEKKLRLAMKIGGEYAVYPRRSTWHKAAAELRVPADELVDRVRDVAARAPDAFADAAATDEVKSLKRQMPARLVSLVAERVSRCIDVVQRTTSGHSR